MVYNKDVVKTITEEKIDKIITTEYVEKKIYEKSEPVIKKILSEFQKDAKALMEENYTYNDWADRGYAAHGAGNYELALICFKKAIDKRQRFSLYPSADKLELWYFNTWLAEVKILLKDYNGALETIKKSQEFASDEDKKAIIYFQEYMCKKLLKQNTSETEEKLDKILKYSLDIIWNFEAIEKQLKAMEISNEDKLSLMSKLELLKKYYSNP